MWRRNYVFLIIIVSIWTCAFVINQSFFSNILGWDEIEYISVAKGIALDGDLSTRHYSVMGLIKQGYPTHLGVYPIYSAYLSIFYKLGGGSLSFMYFGNWLLGLLT